MNFVVNYVSNNFITLLLLIAFEFILFLNRKLNVGSARYMQIMVVVIALISLRDTLGALTSNSLLLSELFFTLSKNFWWLDGQFYFLLFLSVIPIERKLLLSLPQLVNIAVCTGSTFIPVFSGHTGEAILRDISFAVMLFYLLLLTIYAIDLIIKRSFIDGFIIIYIAAASIIVIILSKMGLAEGSLDEAAAVMVVLYFGYCVAVEQSSIQSRLFENKLELAQSKMTVLMAQIQPHFIFNSLMAIQAQCIDYPEVYESIDNFSHYLRSNFDSLGDTKPIPFERELENIEAYLSLERLNYGDRLKVERSIDVTDFMLPALSVEPLVENAVRHGVATFENGGTVRISVKRTTSFIVVEVRDFGEGERNITEKQKKRRGIGIDNVRARLAASSMGRLEIHSEENGTQARLILNNTSTEREDTQ